MSVLEAPEATSWTENTTHERRYRVLKAYGLVHENRFVEAEETARGLIRDYPDAVDAYFVLTYVHLSLRELESAQEACEKYFEQVSQLHSRDSGQHYAITHAHTSQAYNFRGTIAQDLGDTDNAIRHFENAIEAHHGNHLPYLNLARLLERREEFDRARTIVADGIKACSQVQELRLLQERLERNTTVAACMIVKDEEELLPGCLDSIRDWVDEIIVVDTGSSDKTVDIARSYGAKMFFQKWEGDFSKHRNYSLDQAASDWILIIDADERVNQEDVVKIRRQISEETYRALAVNVFNYSGKFNEKVTSLASVRLFKRELGLRYKGIVHNQLVIDPAEPVLRTDVRIDHFGYGLSEDRMAEKAARTTDLLKMQIDENPADAFAWFNYAQVLLGMDFARHPDNPAEIIKAASRAVELTSPDSQDRSERDIHLMSLQQLALTSFIIQDLSGAEEYARRALKHKPDYLDTILLMGNISLRLNEPDAAESYFNSYLRTQKKYEYTTGVDEILLLHPKSFHHAYYGLGIVAESRQKWDKARQYYLDVLDYSPEFLDTNARLGHIYLRLQEHDSAITYFKKQLELEPSSHLAAIGLAGVYYIRGESEEAAGYLERSLEAVPAQHPALFEYVRFLMSIGRDTEAGRFLKKAAEHPDPDRTLLLRLAESHFELGEYKPAVQFYSKLVETDPSNSDWLNDLGGCFFRLGELEKAEHYYERAATAADYSCISLRNLGMTRIKAGKLREAVEPLRKYLQEKPSDLEVKVLVADLLTEIEEYGSAIVEYEGLLRSRSTDTALLFKLAECYLHLGHRDSAQLGYRRILQVDPGHRAARNRLSEHVAVSEIVQ